MTESTTRLNYLSPLWIVSALQTSLKFYRDQLGFDVTTLLPADDPFFAILVRDGVHVMLKEIEPGVCAVPNATRHDWARWDAYVYVTDPDGLVAEFQKNAVVPSLALADTEDGLRGFEVKDPDGYVLFFGRPLS